MGLLIANVGCIGRTSYGGPARFDRGLVFILPGIEGESIWNRSITRGLYEGGVQSAIELYDWTVGVPGSLLINLAFLERNREQAENLAARIAEYARRHPGRPVHLIGHSGGAGVIIMALEMLPESAAIERAILLAPAVSQEYDLTTALRRTNLGILNFYSPNDVTLLRIGTTLFGSMDREHGAAAGSVGFRAPAGIAPESVRVYSEKLRQVRWTPRLRAFGVNGTHMGWTSQTFARRYLADLIRKRELRSWLSREGWKREEQRLGGEVEPLEPNRPEPATAGGAAEAAMDSPR